MTGGGFIPTAHVDDYELDELGHLREGSGGGHAVQWVGTPSVRGPKWARMSLLTVGMLGIQCVWSIEMGYASPYLLELGLSKSWMSLVFMAGPLSGLIVQPLIGVLADRSKSKWGRRRPWMISGAFICAFAIMLLGWAGAIGDWFVGGHSGEKGNRVAIVLAVFSIYLIDFSINAVMSADRALVVDTLPPEKQEEGSAFGGRMFACGSVAGFFVGNLDLPPVFPWLGKTQLQILSFITAGILLATHGLTSWAVTERVLLRDDRPQSKTGLLHSLRTIWENMFSLPPGIRTVCVVQFFSFLGWFPILFFTTVWVSEIYIESQPDLDPLDPQVQSDAVRAGARALFFQALVNIICSFALPPIIAESGVQPDEKVYAQLNGHAEAYPEEPRSALWKRAQEEFASGNALQRSVGWAREMVRNIKSGEYGLPIKGLTVIKTWWISQFVFAAAMGASWFIRSVSGAYVIIAITGFSWALAQWAPYALLGELILIEGEQDRHETSEALFDADLSRQRNVDEQDGFDTDAETLVSSPTHHRRKSDPSRKAMLRVETRFENSEPSPLIPASSHLQDAANETSLVLHHSDEEDLDDFDGDSSHRSASPVAPMRHRSSAKGRDTADKAGVILGIHNVFLVLPQFIVTIMSSIIFYFMEPSKIAQIPVEADMGPGSVDTVTRREGMGEGASSDAVGLIFRIGGLSALIGGIICMRLGRSWKRGEGI